MFYKLFIYYQRNRLSFADFQVQDKYVLARLLHLVMMLAPVKIMFVFSGNIRLIPLLY